MTETCINQFRNYLRSEEKAEATISKYLHDVKEMLVFIEKMDLNKDSLIEYRKYLTCRYKPQTVNGKLSAINAFLRFKDLLEFKVKCNFSYRIQIKATSNPYNSLNPLTWSESP